MNESDYRDRFGGIERLYGAQMASKLPSARVAVVGIGGVGSWTVEALARSGIGHLTLIDLDDLCISNVNRQIHALSETVGLSKVSVMADRVKAIHPSGSVTAVQEFYTAQTSDSILGAGFDCVVDAIDHTANKCLLIAECRRRGIPLVVCGGAGGRIDPTCIRSADLAFTVNDRLLSEVRRRLRRDHGFPRDPEPWNIPAVYTTEEPRLPSEPCGAPPPEPESGTRRNCNTGYGSATFVTGSLGFAAAAEVLRVLAH